MPKPKKLRPRTPRSKDLRGWDRFPKNIFEDPFFGNQPLDEISAFLLLRTEVRAKDAYITVKGCSFPVLAGQLSHSIEHFADLFGWTISSTRRFLKRLEKAGRIEISNEFVQQVITICYDVDKEAGVIANKPTNEKTSDSKRNVNERNIEIDNIFNKEDKIQEGTRRDVPSASWIDFLIERYGETPVCNWFRHTRLEDGQLIVPTDTAKRYIEQLFGQSLTSAIGHPVKLVVRAVN